MRQSPKVIDSPRILACYADYFGSLDAFNLGNQPCRVQNVERLISLAAPGREIGAVRLDQEMIKRQIPGQDLMAR